MSHVPLGTAIVPSLGREYVHLIMECREEPAEPIVPLDAPVRPTIRIVRFYVTACGKRSSVDPPETIEFSNNFPLLCADCWNTFPVVRDAPEYQR